MLRQGGVLVVASPYTWRPEYTPMDKWIGGFQKVPNPSYHVFIMH